MSSIILKAANTVNGLNCITIADYLRLCHLHSNLMPERDIRILNRFNFLMTNDVTQIRFYICVGSLLCNPQSAFARCRRTV